MSRFLSLIFVALSVLSLSSKAIACTCKPITKVEQFGLADVIANLRLETLQPTSDGGKAIATAVVLESRKGAAAGERLQIIFRRGTTCDPISFPKVGDTGWAYMIRGPEGLTPDVCLKLTTD